MPKFEVYKDTAGKFRFRLRNNNYEIVAIGEAYEQHASCLNGVKSVKKNCKSPLEDLTTENAEKFTNPKFQITKDAAEKLRFRLKASNGEIIAEGGQGYPSKEALLADLATVRESCDAEILDLTTTSETETKPTTSNQTNENMASKEEAPSGEINMAKEDEMLAELVKIRQAVEKPPAPPAPKGLWNEFKDFLSKYKVLGLAIAFVLGLYLGTLVQSLVTGLVMPTIGLALPGLGNLSDAFFEVNGQKFLYGNFIAALITFIIVALIAFIVVKAAKRWKIE